MKKRGGNGPAYTEREIRRMHDRLTKKLGRAPMCKEMCAASGMSDCWVRHKCAALGLALTPFKRGMEPEKEPGGFLKVHCAGVDLRQRIAQIEAGGDAAARPDVLPRPGAGYAPGARIMIACAVCGRKVMICPRTHAFYLRDAAGDVHFTCSDVCAGMTGIKGAIH